MSWLIKVRRPRITRWGTLFLLLVLLAGYLATILL